MRALGNSTRALLDGLFSSAILTFDDLCLATIRVCILAQIYDTGG